MMPADLTAIVFLVMNPITIEMMQTAIANAGRMMRALDVFICVFLDS